MLSRSRQQFPHGLSEEEKATLMISKQILIDSGLTIPEFTNSIHEIAEKGYIWHIVIYDENLRSQINDFINSDQYSDALEKFKKLDTQETSDKLQEAGLEQFRKIAPPSVNLDAKETGNDFLKFSDLFKDGIEVFKKMRPDEIGFILLMPFRDVETLFNKMNKGEKFDDIQDDGFWYDQNKFEFHIDGEVVKTSSRGLPNLSHTVLSMFFSKPSVVRVEYEEMIGFDHSKGNEPYRDAMRKFIKTYSKLGQMFSVHLYHTEFHPDKYNEIP